MPSVNRAELIGHLGRDPETRYTPNGTAYCKFSIATSEKWKDKQSGEKKEKTEWHNIVAWGKLAEIVGEYASKGRLVYVTGKLQTSSWEKDGATHYKTEIVADNVILLDKQNDTGRGHQNPKADPVHDNGDDITF